MKQETTAGTEPRRRRSREYSAKEKAQAVLALWSGRRSPSALSKELELPWAMINTWEKRALSGMLTALDPTWKQVAEAQPSLPRRVERLIEQTLKPAAAAEPAAAN
jgi:transposase-like protein